MRVMNGKTKAAIGVGLALFAAYRWARRVEDAAEEYRRRGPRWDVIVPGVIATYMLLVSIGEADAAIRKARRAF